MIIDKVDINEIKVVAYMARPVIIVIVIVM